MSSHFVAPQSPLKWDHTPESILKLAKESIDVSKARQDDIAHLKPAEYSFQTVFQALALSQTELDHVADPIAFYQNVSTSKELRDASNEAESLIREYEVESSMRIDVYEVVQRTAEIMKENGEFEKLGAEEKRLAEKIILDGRRAGLSLPTEAREELKNLKKELASTTLEFLKNFGQSNGFVSFTREELEGLPETLVSGFAPISEGDESETKYKVTFKTPDIIPVFKYAKNPTTRRRAHDTYDSRLEINVPLVGKVVDLRRRIVSLLGYKTRADHVLEVNMIKNGDAVLEFLADLQQRLRPVGLNDYSNLLALKKLEYPDATDLYIWDYWYYDRLFVEKSLDLDDLLIKDYFPVDVVVPKVLKIYREMLGVRFEEVKRKEGDSLTWHPDVQLFAVWEHDAKEPTDFLGYLHLDLFPREAKFPHAAVWSLNSGYIKPDGIRHCPVTAMVANLAKPNPAKSATMRHADVITFFHEMGHAFHNLLSKTQFSRCHGTSVAQDFVEAPSKMLENWCWEPKVLQNMSSHFETKEPLSPELIEKLVRSRFINTGVFNLRQLFYGTFDIKIHTDSLVEINDYSQLWCEMRESIALFKSGEKATLGEAAFGHIATGYAAGYYGYMYSLVYAMDMYKTVFSIDPLDPIAGRRYRNEILLPGGSRDEIESLTALRNAFLGRAPNSEAFLKHIMGT